MKLSVKGFALAAAIVWGLGMLLINIFNALSPGYAAEFLVIVGSIYPGYEPGLGLESIIIGTLYGFVDAGIAGAIFAWVYNSFAK